MGDIIALLSGLNLSPVNTILLAILIFIFTRFDARLKKLECTTNDHSTTIAVVKDRLNIET